MRQIYLDNSATTPVRPEAADAMWRFCFPTTAIPHLSTPGDKCGAHY